MNLMPSHYADCDIPAPEKIRVWCVYGEVTDTSSGVNRNRLDTAHITLTTPARSLSCLNCLQYSKNYGKMYTDR
jgi:hypothetical protein